MRDIDLKTGKKTVATKYGEGVSKIISRICVAIAISEALVLFLFGWLSPTFLFFLGLFYLFGFGFWYYLQRYTPRVIHNAIGPTWGAAFALIMFFFLVYLRQIPTVTQLFIPLNNMGFTTIIHRLET
jgi:1,4-dihydroxy-2-naphthoate octaprenyltransferase